MGDAGRRAHAGDPAAVRGVLLDLDGTVYEGDRLLPGAADALAALEFAGLGVLFGTNTTRMPRTSLVEHLARIGLRVTADRIHTAPLAACRWLEERGFIRIALHVPEAAAQDFSRFTLDDEQPEAAVVGDLGPLWSFERLNRAFRQVLGGAALVALQRNRFWKTADGLTLDAGPMVAAIEYAAGVSATVVGKPSEPFMRSAAAALGIECAAMAVVGDDLGSDIAGAASCGATGVLVRTGKFRDEDLARSPWRPHLVIDSIADLPGALGVWP